MAKRYKEERAGRLVRCVCYTAPLPRDNEKTRAEKSKITSAARAKINLRYSWQKCRLKLAANFEAGDLFVTLTYDNDHLPANRQEAVRCIRKWIKSVRTEYRRYDVKLKYLYCTESRHGEGRYHHHVVMNRTERADEVLQALWSYGFVHIQSIDDQGFEELSRYFTKEAADSGRKVGQRAWTASLNLKEPEVTSMFVPDNFSLSLPPGCRLIENPTMRNYFGEYAYLEYLTPPDSVASHS